VHSTHGTSWNNKRLCPKAEAFQVSKHSVEFHADESRHVFTQDVSGFTSFNNVEHCRPEEAVIACAASLAGDGKRLARESARDEVTLDCWNSSHVSIVRNFWPVVFQHLAGSWFDFTKADCFESSGRRRQSEAPDTAKEVEVSATVMANKAMERNAGWRWHIRYRG
jgi:hypothetical protein